MSNNLEVKIKDLIPAPELKDSAEYPISQDGVTYKVNQAQIEGKIVGKLGDRFIPVDQKGVANGIAPLDGNKKIPNENLNFGEVQEGDENVVSGGEVYETIKNYSSGIKIIDLSTETPSKDGIFQPIEVGVYPNFGNLELTQEEKESSIVYFYLINGVFSKETKSVSTINEVEKDNTNAISSKGVYDWSIRNVSTIEKLRKIKGKEGQKINLLGYYEEGDKPTIMYKWSSEVKEDNGGSIISNTEGHWRALFTSNSVNVKHFGAKGDGVNDDTESINKTITNTSIAILPSGEYRVTDTIVVGKRSRGIIGESKLKRELAYAKPSIIKYDGAEDKDTVVLIGTNRVGEEPTVDATNIVIENIIIDCGNKAKIGLYGTYITGDSVINKVTVLNSKEYGMFFAKAWYASFKELISINGHNNGISFGMPLKFLNQEEIEFTTGASYEINSCEINNIRAFNNGQSFNDSNKYIIKEENILSGYGVGFGYGNSFNVSNFTSEQNGGAGVVIYNGFQPIKTIQKGYLENNAKTLSKDSSPQMIIVNKFSTGGDVVIEDVFININSGGIYHQGNLSNSRLIRLKNIQQPNFLKSIDEGVHRYDLYKYVLKESVYYLCGEYNTDTRKSYRIVSATVNTRYDWTIEVPENMNGYYMIDIKTDGTNPIGSYEVIYWDDTTVTRPFRSGLNDIEYKTDWVFNKSIKTIKKAGGTASYDSNVNIVVYRIVTSLY